MSDSSEPPVDTAATRPLKLAFPPELPISEHAEEIRDLLEHQLDLVIDGGFCGLEPTTVVNLEEEAPEITRAGRGDTALFTS